MRAWFAQRLDTRLLRVLWSVDVGFAVLYLVLGGLVAAGRMESIPDRLSIGKDWSLSESVNYLKWVAVIVLLVMTALRRRLAWPVMLAAAFVIILADDALRFHERELPILGSLLPEAVRGMATPEILTFGLLGLVVVGFIGLSLLLADRGERWKLVTVLCLICSVAFFSVFVDMMHDAFPLGQVGYGLWVLVEEGAELMLTSVILAFVAGSIWREGRTAARTA